MSEKEQQFERIYKETESFGRTQFVREIQMQINENKQLQSQLQQKENIIKEIKEEMENAKHISVDDSKAIIKHEKRILEILNKEVNDD